MLDELNPTIQVFHWSKVRELLQHGKFHDAFNQAQNIIRPDCPCEILIDYIHILIKIQYLNEAKKWLTILQTRYKNSKEYYLLLGHVYFKEKNWPQANHYYHKTLNHDPNNFHACYNLGLIGSIQENFDSACIFFEKCKLLTKNLPPHYHQNFGMALLYEQRVEESLEHLQLASHFLPKDVEVLFHLGLCNHLLGQFEQAQSSYEQALCIDPKHCPSLHNLATVAISLNQHAKAIITLKKLSLLQPKDVIVETLLDALGAKSRKKHHQTFITTLFDQYAFNYDKHLREVLRYNPFEKARDLMNKVFNLNAFQCGLTCDLGCGTGLAAPFFNDLSYKTIGIDLSEGMLLQAKHKGYYDELIHDDIIDFLRGERRLFKTVLGFEITNYLGERTHTLLELLSRRCLPGALIVLTFEKNVNNQKDIYLNDNVRFTFHQDYIEHDLFQKNWRLCCLEETTLRQEHGKSVKGFIALGKLGDEVIERR